MFKYLKRAVELTRELELMFLCLVCPCGRHLRWVDTGGRNAFRHQKHGGYFLWNMNKAGLLIGKLKSAAARNLLY